MPGRVTVGVSLKMYFGHRRAVEWFAEVAELVRAHPGVRSGEVELFVIPTYLQIHAALAAFSGMPVRIGAQDVTTEDAGPYTGEVSAAELAEVGVSHAEIGHAERRRLYGDTEEVIAAKTAAALRNGIVPVLCIGELVESHPAEAALVSVEQLEAAVRDAPHGPLVVAYEPVWAIGAAHPAPPEHIVVVTRALRTALERLPGRSGSVVVYGGSAGPGLLGELGADVDGLFLGRFAHDPVNLVAVLDEAAQLAAVRGGGSGA